MVQRTGALGTLGKERYACINAQTPGRSGQDRRYQRAGCDRATRGGTPLDGDYVFTVFMLGSVSLHNTCIHIGQRIHATRDIARAHTHFHIRARRPLSGKHMPLIQFQTVAVRFLSQTLDMRH